MRPGYQEPIGGAAETWCHKDMEWTVCGRDGCPRRMVPVTTMHPVRVRHGEDWGLQTGHGEPPPPKKTAKVSTGTCGRPGGWGCCKGVRGRGVRV